MQKNKKNVSQPGTGAGGPASAESGRVVASVLSRLKAAAQFAASAKHSRPTPSPALVPCPFRSPPVQPLWLPSPVPAVLRHWFRQWPLGPRATTCHQPGMKRRCADWLLPPKSCWLQNWRIFHVSLEGLRDDVYEFFIWHRPRRSSMGSMRCRSTFNRSPARSTSMARCRLPRPTSRST